MADDEMVSLTPNYDEIEEDDEAEDDDEELAEEDLPSLTYRITDGDIVSGHVDGLDAMKQAIRLILTTERYDYDILPWEYGVELKHIFGMPTDYCVAELERVIKEALLRDDRISAVDGFAFEARKRNVAVSFTVHTVYGDLDMEQDYDV
jgi:phage baseplate assembly protein W